MLQSIDSFGSAAIGANRHYTATERKGLTLTSPGLNGRSRILSTTGTGGVDHGQSPICVIDCDEWVLLERALLELRIDAWPAAHDATVVCNAVAKAEAHGRRRFFLVIGS